MKPHLAPAERLPWSRELPARDSPETVARLVPKALAPAGWERRRPVRLFSRDATRTSAFPCVPLLREAGAGTSRSRSISAERGSGSLRRCQVTVMTHFSLMSTVVEIEAAVEKLNPKEVLEFAAWFEQRQALLNAAESVFIGYDEDEANAKVT